MNQPQANKQPNASMSRCEGLYRTWSWTLLFYSIKCLAWHLCVSKTSSKIYGERTFGNLSKLYFFVYVFACLRNCSIVYKHRLVESVIKRPLYIVLCPDRFFLCLFPCPKHRKKRSGHARDYSIQKVYSIDIIRHGLETADPYDAVLVT